jgi:hypothetical protein
MQKGSKLNFKLIQKGIIMKNKLAITGVLLTLAFTMPMFGQAAQENLANVSVTKRDTTEVSAKPTFEATTAGVHMKVWFMSKEGEMKENDMSSAKATKEATPAVSYHVMVELKDAASGKDVSDATASLMAVSPAGKNTVLELKPMMDQLGGNLNLDEKGEYQFTLNVTSSGVINGTQFKYTVQ